jgi:hypothetical protein
MLKSQGKKRSSFELGLVSTFSFRVKISSFFSESWRSISSEGGFKQACLVLDVERGERRKGEEIKIFIELEPPFFSFVKVHKIYEAKNNNDKETPKKN